MTKLEKQYAQMTPAQRKAANKAVSEMMGMPRKKSATKKTTKKK